MLTHGFVHPISLRGKRVENPQRFQPQNVARQGVAVQR